MIYTYEQIIDLIACHRESIEFDFISGIGNYRVFLSGVHIGYISISLFDEISNENRFVYDEEDDFYFIARS